MAVVAAIAPSLTAVVSCLNCFTLVSPATYIPSIFVCTPSSDSMYPYLSIFIKLANISFFGLWPTAMNSPSISIFFVSPLLLVISIPFIDSSPISLVILEFRII